jgi:hypothetical protein
VKEEEKEETDEQMEGEFEDSEDLSYEGSEV